jgi:hypothetical protein
MKADWASGGRSTTASKIESTRRNLSVGDALTSLLCVLEISLVGDAKMRTR